MPSIDTTKTQSKFQQNNDKNPQIAKLPNRKQSYVNKENNQGYQIKIPHDQQFDRTPIYSNDKLESRY